MSNAQLLGLTLSSKSNQNKSKSYHLNVTDIADTLENDPNLAAFFDADTITEVKQIKYGIDFDECTAKEQQVQNFRDIESVLALSTATTTATAASNKGNPVIKNENIELDSSVATTDDYLAQMINENSHLLPKKSSHTVTISSPDLGGPLKEPPSRKTKGAVSLPNDNSLIDFLNKFEIPSPNSTPKHLPLEKIVQSALPMVFISRLTSPHLNLALERYIYEKFPVKSRDDNDSLDLEFAKRLFLYKNSSCIVVGKNQNIFKEINFRFASATQTSILRRYSGGGTVVHDDGNFCFGFICPKDEFNRIGFTTGLIEKWNDYFKSGQISIKLSTNDKGDMIDEHSKKKVSGSAFQISKGRSLHHGTMLLSADLTNLSKLLKINKDRLLQIKDKATDSIPSPVMNTSISADLFMKIAVGSFVENYGLPLNLEKKTQKLLVDNIHIAKAGPLQCQVFKVDDLTPLPQEVYEMANDMQKWDWVFAKTPKFEQTIEVDGLKIKFIVAKGRIAQLEYEGNDNSQLTKLKGALETDTPVWYRSDSIKSYISGPLGEKIAWNVDQWIKYSHVNVQV